MRIAILSMLLRGLSWQYWEYSILGNMLGGKNPAERLTIFFSQNVGHWRFFIAIFRQSGTTTWTALSNPSELLLA